MRKLLVFMSILLSVSLCSCDAQAAGEEGAALCVATWNVQNLFDASFSGLEYEEYGPDSGWTEAMYQRRLDNVRRVLGYLPKARDYIIVLNEVEGPDVVEDMVLSEDIASMGLRYYACAGAVGGSIQTAVISSLPIVSAKVHDVGTGQRPVLEVCFGELFVLAVHYKSNVGGVLDAAAIRREEARATAQIVRTLEAENPGCLVLVAGDMNDECWEDGIIGPSGELPTTSGFGRGLWHCFWLSEDPGLWPRGSLMYNDRWLRYDNFLVSQAAFDGSGLELSGCGVVFKGVLVSTDSKPARWDRRLLKGVSDHLPVWINLNNTNLTSIY